MRSSIFEAQVVRQKLQETLDSGKPVVVASTQTNCWEFADVTEKKRLQAMENVLALCLQKQCKTKILSILASTVGRASSGFMRYLVSQGLLGRSRTKYYTTRKGQRLLTLLVKLHTFFGVDQPA